MWAVSTIFELSAKPMYVNASERALAQISMPYQTQFGRRAIKEDEGQKANRRSFYPALAILSAKFFWEFHTAWVLRAKNIITWACGMGQEFNFMRWRRTSQRWRNKTQQASDRPTLAATTYFFFWMTHADTSLSARNAIDQSSGLTLLGNQVSSKIALWAPLLENCWIIDPPDAKLGDGVWWNFFLLVLFVSKDGEVSIM